MNDKWDTRFVVRCYDHPIYMGVYKPTVDCYTCKVLWDMENNPEFPVCGIDLLMMQDEE